ncbi:unnamed protein product [Ectocarpus sp. 13 AM-2016]
MSSSRRTSSFQLPVAGSAAAMICFVLAVGCVNCTCSSAALSFVACTCLAPLPFVFGSVFGSFAKCVARLFYTKRFWSQASCNFSVDHAMHSQLVSIFNLPGCRSVDKIGER